MLFISHSSKKSKKIPFCNLTLEQKGINTNKTKDQPTVIHIRVVCLRNKDDYVMSLLRLSLYTYTCTVTLQRSTIQQSLHLY